MAVLLDAPTRAALAEAAARLRAAAGALPVSWTAADNYHVTVKFLGNVDGGRVDEIAAALRDAARGHAPFTLVVGGLGAFPSALRPRVLWAGITAGGEAVTSVAGAVDAGLARLGLPREARDFSPHVTIGRVRESRRVPALVEALDGNGEFGRVAVDAVTLMRSELSPRGARYTPLASAPLGG
ncbi:MAG: RNA 2',3'-cyclic phosphodiesterase [Candidatus Rokubacteria bacterium]|nr:RNA 2',3'-cyclic phosphodiesterase [Candidatus Rokubacteria bacterium]